jgi:hypothetical protein
MTDENATSLLCVHLSTLSKQRIKGENKNIEIHVQIIEYQRKISIRNVKSRCIFFVQVVPAEESLFPSSGDINGYFHLTIVPTPPSLNKNNKRKEEPSQISCGLRVSDRWVLVHSHYPHIYNPNLRFKKQEMFVTKPF